MSLVLSESRTFKSRSLRWASGDKLVKTTATTKRLDCIAVTRASYICTHPAHSTEHLAGTLSCTPGPVNWTPWRHTMLYTRHSQLNTFQAHYAAHPAHSFSVQCNTLQFALTEYKITCGVWLSFCMYAQGFWWSVERCLGVGLCGQPWPSAWPCRPTTWLRSTSSTVHPSEPVPDRPRYLPCQPPSLRHGSVWPVSMRTAETMTRIVDDCPQTKFAGGLEALHEADNDAVQCLQTTATIAFAKWNNGLKSQKRLKI